MAKQRFLGPPTQIPVDPPGGIHGRPNAGGGFGQWTGPGIHPILQSLISHLTGNATGPAVPNTFFHPQTWDGAPTANYGDTTAGNQIGDYLAGAHTALAPGGGALPDGGTATPAAAAAGLSWLPGWTPNPGQDITGRTPYNTGAHWIATHGIWGTPGQDPLTSLTALRNAMRAARGNTSVWAPPAGYVPKGAAAMFQPGVAPSAWGAMPDYHPPAT